MTRAVDRFWGLPASTAVTISAAPDRGSSTLEEITLTPLEDERVMLPELRPVAGQPLIEARGAGGERVTLAAVGDGGVELAFDPDAAVAALTWRNALTAGRPLASRTPFHYHRVPAPVRRLVRNALTRRSSAAGGARYPAWPADASVEAVRRIYLRARQAAEPELEPVPPWPDGKRFAIALTHDVDSATGLTTSLDIARDEADRGLMSCWYVVGDDYPLPPSALSELRDGGHELGLHDAHHDNKIAFLDPKQISDRLDRCRPLIEEYGMAGFRSPSMLRSERLYDALEPRFAYDSSIPDTGLLPRPNGCATVFPFQRGALQILPLTLPPDGQLLGRGLGPAEVVRAWIDKAEWIARMGGAAVHLTHPEPGFSASPGMRSAYREFLDWVRGREDAWVARPSEIVEHWRSREASALATGRE